MMEKENALWNISSTKTIDVGKKQCDRLGKYHPFVFEKP